MWASRIRNVCARLLYLLVRCARCSSKISSAVFVNILASSEPIFSRRVTHTVTKHNSLWCASGCVVECRICNREVADSNLSLGYFAPRSTQPSIPPGSVNEYQLRLGWQRQVWLIPIADERVGVQVKL